MAFAQRPNDTINASPAKLPLPVIEQGDVWFRKETATIDKNNRPSRQPLSFNQTGDDGIDLGRLADHQQYLYSSRPKPTVLLAKIHSTQGKAVCSRAVDCMQGCGSDLCYWLSTVFSEMAITGSTEAMGKHKAPDSNQHNQKSDPRQYYRQIPPLNATER
ncbi:hypothetical protein [Pseudomonas putida]|uniref:hypothetical protein n=1 Tax=Pseudomonas putida TaxID=303 RepID=UPI00357121E2